MNSVSILLLQLATNWPALATAALDGLCIGNGRRNFNKLELDEKADFLPDETGRFFLLSMGTEMQHQNFSNANHRSECKLHHAIS